MQKLIFKVDKIVLHQASIKAVRKNGHSSIITDDKYKLWKANIKSQVPFDFPIFTQAIWISIQYIYPIPKSIPKKEKEKRLGQPKITTPDLGNLNKGLEDALNGSVYKDDALIVKYKECSKYWTDDLEQDKIIIKIETEEI